MTRLFDRLLPRIAARMIRELCDRALVWFDVLLGRWRGSAPFDDRRDR